MRGLVKTVAPVDRSLSGSGSIIVPASDAHLESKAGALD